MMITRNVPESTTIALDYSIELIQVILIVMPTQKPNIIDQPLLEIINGKKVTLLENRCVEGLRARITDMIRV